jgi:hypothetical protein
MKLFHYTNPGNYLRIAASGITPHASDENAYMTAGVPVVWLTQQASNVATAKHLALMVKSYGEEMARLARPMPLSSFLFNERQTNRRTAFRIIKVL